MSKKNHLSGRDKELDELTRQYESAQAENKPIYMDADDIADMAEWCMGRGKVMLAEEMVEYGLRLHPDSTSLLVEKAYFLIDSGENVRARKLIDRIGDEYSAEVKILKANLLLREGKINETELVLDTIEDKDELGNIAEIVYMYLELGYPDKAQSWLKRGEKKYADEEEFIALQADCLFNEGKTEHALEQYNRLLDINPYSAVYWNAVARCHFQMMEFEKAIEACDFALVVDEEFADAYLLKGHAFFQLGNEEASLESYTQAQKYDAVTPDYLHAFIGLSKTANEEWEEGLKHLELAIQDKEDVSDIAPLYANAALCLYQMGKKRQSNQYFKKAHEVDPEEYLSYLIEGRVRLAERKEEKAAKCFLQALKYSPSEADTWNEIGIYCMDYGMLQGAREAFEHVKEIEADFSGVNERLAAISILLHDKESFLKYNKLCKYPIHQAEFKKIEKILNGMDDREMAQAVMNILKSIR